MLPRIWSLDFGLWPLNCVIQRFAALRSQSHRVKLQPHICLQKPKTKDQKPTREMLNISCEVGPT
jgi:hypothetical protein